MIRVKAQPVHLYKVKKGFDGTLAWAKRTAASSLTDYARSIAVLSDGTAVAAGRFAGTAIFGAVEVNRTALTAGGDGDVFVARFHP